MAKGKQIALGIGIAIILAIFTGFFAWQFANDYKQSCIENNNVCCTLGGLTGNFYYQWVNTEQICLSMDGIVSQSGGNSICKNEASSYDEACEDTFKQWFGIVAIIFGVLSLGIGIWLRTNNVISSGLIGGAIINFIMALIAFWDYLQGWSRTIIAGIILAGLIVLAWYKTRD